ncbi:integrase core domain-containing protein [Desulfosediminicola flagellatus]|uniref:integrase core domain-containing protein n=1 Tax=Desulfosediminicola flagellatus TaxID=2569541 RepID=UPI0010ADA45F
MKSYDNPRELAKGIAAYMYQYNSNRPHSSLSDATPNEAYYDKLPKAVLKPNSLSP